MRDPRKVAIAVVLAVAAGVPIARANPPPPGFCEVYRDRCHRLDGPARAHFLGMLRQVVRALPRVPGYRCESEGREMDVVGYGSSARRAAPKDLFENIWCFNRGTDPRKRYPDVSIHVSLSMQAALLPEGGTRDREHDVLVFNSARSVSFAFGKIREWRDAQGVVHRGHDPSTVISHPGEDFNHPAREVIANGPYLVSASVYFESESAEAIDTFVRRFDRAPVLALIAREEARRMADPQVERIAGALP
jgi:hypothetical protein